MALSVRLRVAAGLAAGAVVAAVPIAASAASASSSPSSDALVKVQPGISVSSLPGAAPFGNTPASTPETVSFVLRENHLSQLESADTHGDFNYKNFLSVKQFASEYGQAATASALTAYLAKFGVTTSVYADDIDVVANGTAGEFDQALSVTQQDYHIPALHGRDGAPTVPAQTVHGSADAPELPEYIAKNVLAVLGLTNYSPFVTSTSHVNTSVLKTTAGATPADNQAACLASTGLPDACNLPSDFASEYGLSPLYKKADGAGETIAIVTLAALDQGAPQYFWQNVAGVPNTGRTVTVDNVDGGPGAPSNNAGTGETDLDVEQSGGLAPGANVIVYQAPNSDTGFADSFFTAASQNIADTVSSSWGESETVVQWAVEDGIETPAYEAAFDEAFLEFGAQGQSIFLSSGDAGAYDATEDLGTTNLAVDTNADSPYATAAGGTTLPWSGTLSNSAGTVTANVDVPAQRAWSWDYLWQPVATVESESYADSALSQVVGDGGGFSAVEARPAYQDDVPGIGHYTAVNDLTPTDYETIAGSSLVEPTNFTVNPTPSITSGFSGGRALPDVSTDADPYSGYLLYEPSFTQASEPTLQGGWGGTSFVAPQLNGSTAVIDSYLGHRVGFWNPSIYAFATSGNDPFTPLNAVGTSNDNLYYTGNPGSVYNEATGLGIPNLAKLAAAFAR